MSQAACAAVRYAPRAGGNSAIVIEEMHMAAMRNVHRWLVAGFALAAALGLLKCVLPLQVDELLPLFFQRDLGVQLDIAISPAQHGTIGSKRHLVVIGLSSDRMKGGRTEIARCEIIIGEKARNITKTVLPEASGDSSLLFENG